MYERTERRGPVFERLRGDVDALAALGGMMEVFKLRAADIYRVLDIELVPSARRRLEDYQPPEPDAGTVDAGGAGRARVAAGAGRRPRHAGRRRPCRALADLFGHEHSMLLLLDEDGTRLFTIASHGYDARGRGVGGRRRRGPGRHGGGAGHAAADREPAQMDRYSRTVRRSFEGAGDLAPGHEIPVPDLPDAQSRLAVPALALGQLVGVLVVESTASGGVHRRRRGGAHRGGVARRQRGRGRAQPRSRGATRPRSTPRADPAADASAGPATRVRFFEVDGSTFLDGDYLIKGVAGRILWALLGHHDREGRVDFSNREMRLDPSLDLPPFRDNFESRLILLKRRLDEREAPIRIEKTSRGCFRLVVEGPVALETGMTGAVTPRR